MRFLIVLMFLTGTTTVQQLRAQHSLEPPTQHTWDAHALDPVLAKVAQQFNAGADWRDTADRNNVLYREGGDGLPRLLFEIAEYGQRTPYDDTHLANRGGTLAERLAALDLAFASLEWIDSGSPSFQRGWIAPNELLDFHTSVLAELPFAVTMRWMAPINATFGSTVSQGPAAMKADVLEELGTRGAGIKIAVLDLGFGGLTSTAAAEVGTVATHPSQSLSSLNSDTETHGTSCVEVIRDMAPDAQILVIREDVSMDVGTAASYATAWGADIISRSVNDFFYPQVSPACTAATTAVGAGVDWISSAGNAASGHYWESNSYTIGTGGFVRFSGAVEVNQLAIPSLSGDISVHLSYEAPTSGYAHYQLALYEDTGSGLVLVGSGTAGVPLIQSVTYTPAAGAAYYVAVFQTATGTLGRMRLASSWGTPYTYQYNNTYGSVMNPATLTIVASVGAVSTTNYTSSGTPEGYSSRGGGIFNLPLAFCAPTDCSTVSAGATPFNGTSCACPNFAGFLALHYSRPEYVANPLGFMIAVDIGAAGNDDDSGAGIIIAAVDMFESDNTSANATSLGSTSTTSTPHALTPANDVDWYVFTLATAGDVDLETTGTTGNTRITLYDSGLSVLGSDDDGGTGQFSKLTSPFLSAGTYYVLVDEPTQGNIVGYDLVLTITRNAPGQVTLVSPTNGATGQSVPVGLTWTAASSLAPVTYESEIALDASFSNVIESAAGITGTTTSTVSLSANTMYWWRVRASNPYGTGTWSSSRSFTTSSSGGGGSGNGGGGGGEEGSCTTTPANGWLAFLTVLAFVSLAVVRQVLQPQTSTG